ncbi:hypothetical protein [Acinetobacter lanii]|uniref:Uncharacterized protein n=1 Tax=Acinetobacter lanii TaxID=2715163 RepID=A0A6G8S406_9GAMM|nr:hypothetical protein [Acinetobacter lanii]QIO08875.1 hypothetical protein G8D99_07500 [Acinetobacter lanii]
MSVNVIIDLDSGYINIGNFLLKSGLIESEFLRNEKGLNSTHFIDFQGDSSYKFPLFLGELKFSTIVSFKKGEIDVVSFQLIDINGEVFNPWDFEGNYNKLLSIFNSENYVEKKKNDFRHYTQFIFRWGEIGVYYEVKSLDCNFYIRWKS